MKFQGKFSKKNIYFLEYRLLQILLGILGVKSYDDDEGMIMKGSKQ